MSLADLPPEARDGLMLNVPELEAGEDLRQIMALGAMFGGKEGKRYIEHLQELAWAPENAETGGKLLDAADARHATFADPPAERPDGL